MKVAKGQTRHLRYAPRHDNQYNQRHADAIAKLAQDDAILAYIADLSTSEKPVSHRHKRQILHSCRHFLNYIAEPITTHAIKDLCEWKAANQNDNRLEIKLKGFKTLEPTNSHERYTSVILGIFHRYSRNSRLDMTIHISARSKHLPIKEPILLAIRNDNELGDEHRIAIDLMAFIGERYTAGNTTPLTEFFPIEGTDFVVIDIPARCTKNGIAHPSIIPRELWERICENAQKKGYRTALPNYVARWYQITQLAKRKYNTRLTSHYFRRRFETACETIPQNDMNINHWMILEGCKPSHGHMPDIYSMSTDLQIIHEYQQFLFPKLTLRNTDTIASESETSKLRRQLAEQAEQINNLTKLLSQLAARTT